MCVLGSHNNFSQISHLKVEGTGNIAFKTFLDVIFDIKVQEIKGSGSTEMIQEKNVLKIWHYMI